MRVFCTFNKGIYFLPRRVPAGRWGGEDGVRFVSFRAAVESETWINPQYPRTASLFPKCREKKVLERRLPGKVPRPEFPFHRRAGRRLLLLRRRPPIPMPPSSILVRFGTIPTLPS